MPVPVTLRQESPHLLAFGVSLQGCVLDSPGPFPPRKGSHTHVLTISCSLPESRSLGGDVASDGDFLIFEGNRYSRKGFLFKSFAMSAVVRLGG